MVTCRCTFCNTDCEFTHTLSEPHHEECLVEYERRNGAGICVRCGKNPGLPGIGGCCKKCKGGKETQGYPHQ